MTGASLLERERESAVIAAALDAAGACAGGVVLVRGEAGIGKTELLRFACARARVRGMQVLEARGGPLERDFAFGVVRQLFEPVVVSEGAMRRDLLAGAATGALDALRLEPEGSDLSRMLHGLYWLSSNLAEVAPAVIAVDDAHWADAASLRWLSYMSSRVADLPVLLVVALRAGEAVTDDAALAAVVGAPGVHRIDLAPLSERGSADLVRRMRGGDVADGFCEACHHATGGNPFYLRELVVETEAQAIAPSEAEAARVTQLGPPAIAAAAVVRIARLPAACADLARAVAVLGLNAELRDAAALGGMGIEAAQSAADALAAAGVLEPRRPLNFAHPVVAAAIYADIPVGARSQAHRRAVEVLARRGVESGYLAVHLLRVEPVGDELVVDVLRSAAGDALRRGAPATAATYLRRALREAPGRSEVLLELGRAELTGGEADAITHVEQALRKASDPDVVTDAAVLAGSALQAADRFDEAREVLEEATARLGDAPAHAHELRLAGVQMQRASCDPAAAAAIGDSLPRWLGLAHAAGPAGAGILIVAGLGVAVRGEEPDRAAALIEAALGRGERISAELADSAFPSMALAGLTAIDELAHADQVIAGLLADARRRGSVVAYVNALIWRGYVALRQGLLALAEADEREAVDLAEQHAFGLNLPWARAFLVSALVDRGALDAAGEASQALALAERETPSVAGYSLDARGRVRIARGHVGEGVSDLLAAGAAHGSLGGTSPNILHWRSNAALALGRDDPHAHVLAGAELAHARRLGFPRALGVALRACGTLDSSEAGVKLLRDAATVLDGSPARLEHARALLHLGGALRRQGRRVDSREPLRQALALADRLGALGLAQEAQAELAATGARPRRIQLTGADALTPTERRVAELAAAGHGNREIAQALFVSRKTVEMHLGHAYRKLDISSRGELADALSPLAVV
jgi:DNA-binding CsgD family transcriptional regulator